MNLCALEYLEKATVINKKLQLQVELTVELLKIGIGIRGDVWN